MKDLFNAMMMLRIAFEERNLPLPDLVTDRDTAHLLSVEQRMDPGYLPPAQGQPADDAALSIFGVKVVVDPKRRPK